MKDQLERFVKKVKELHELCHGNEAITKSSLIAPFFGILGFDTSDPRECLPEFKADLGNGIKAATPVDWAFRYNSAFIFIVEAKEASKKLNQYAEQLGMYFAKAAVKLAILTNGVQWQFYTDLDKPNIMDTKPFLTWDILRDDPIPLDFLNIVQKSQFKPHLIRDYAEPRHKKNLLVNELTRILEPSADFVRLAIKDIETRNLVANVVEEWKPILANALGEWAKQRTLTEALRHQDTGHETQGNGEHPEKPPNGQEPVPDEIRKNFWQGLLARAAKRTPLHAKISPGKFESVGASSGMRGLYLNYVIKQDAGRVELFIDRGAGKAEKNKGIFDCLLKHKEEIERTFGDKLSWQRLDDKQGCRIAYTVTVGGWKSDNSKWPDIQDNMIDAMVRLERALKPQIGSLLKEFSLEGD